MGADDWEDMSDGDGGDWESGKAIAPRSSASGASLASGGSSSSVGVGNGTPSTSVATKWGAAADDAWGDEDDWRPGPAIASPAAARSAGRAVRPSPSRSPGARITGFGGGGRRHSRGRILKRAATLACLVGAAYALLSAGAFGGARDADPFDDAAIGDDVSDSITTYPSSTTRARREDAFASPDATRTTVGSADARVPAERERHDPPDVRLPTISRAPVVERDHDARADASAAGSARRPPAAVDDPLDELGFDDHLPSTVPDQPPSDGRPRDGSGSIEAEDETTHDDRAERDAEEEALAAAAVKAVVAEAEDEDEDDDAVAEEQGGDEDPDADDRLAEGKPLETKTSPPGFEPATRSDQTAKVAPIAPIAPVSSDHTAVANDDALDHDDLLAPDLDRDDDVSVRVETPDEDVSDDEPSEGETAEDETPPSPETVSSFSTTNAAPPGPSDAAKGPSSTKTKTPPSSREKIPDADAASPRPGKTNRRDEKRNRSPPPAAEDREDGPDLTDAENAAKVDAFLSDPKTLDKALADGPKHGYVLEKKTLDANAETDGERSDESGEGDGRRGVDRRSLIERRGDAMDGSEGDAPAPEPERERVETASETASGDSSRQNATRAIAANEEEAMSSSMKSSIETAVAPAPAPGPSLTLDDESGVGSDDGVVAEPSVEI